MPVALTHSGSNFIGALVGKNLDVQVEHQRRSSAVGKGECRRPQIHVDALGLLVFLGAPSAMAIFGGGLVQRRPVAARSVGCAVLIAIRKD